ncbi:MAG: UDP-4-amino-4,6-dideoxy-N-acetyl-beta-L-altrosamine transaminase [Puniceicoccaceae bacterium]
MEEASSRRVIPYGFHSISEADCSAVLETLRSSYLTGGSQVAAFEEEFAAFVGAKYAVAVSNGTTALHLAMRVAGIGPGDRVITSPNTFLASANCAAYVGATPDFADIDPGDYTLSPDSLESVYQPDCRAVIPVAHGGQSADMPAIAAFARSHDMLIIEDGCHGPGGGFLHDGSVHLTGGHQWADMTTFSFHPVKSMTTGEGGMIVTNNRSFAEKARLLRNHGMERSKENFTTFGRETDPLFEEGPWVYEMQDLGYNYRITDFQCALGRTQLQRLPEFIRKRREIVARYNEAFADLPWLTTPGLRNEADRDHISWHLYTVQIDFGGLRQSRSSVMNRLREQGVGSQVLYIPIYLQPWYRETYGYGPGKCPNAEAYYQRCLSLPLFPELTEAEQQTVIDTIRQLPESP